MTDVTGEPRSCTSQHDRLSHWAANRAGGIHLNDYCFMALSAQSWQYRDRRNPEAGTMSYSYFKWLQGLFIVHSTIGSTVHSMPLNSLEQCICTTTMTNIRPYRDSNLVPPGYKPQSIRMSHWGRPGIHLNVVINPSLQKGRGALAEPDCMRPRFQPRRSCVFFSEKYYCSSFLKVTRRWWQPRRFKVETSVHVSTLISRRATRCALRISYLLV